MPLTLSIAIAYLLNRKRQTIISILGVAMGVGFFIAVSAMMQGFQTYFINQVIDITPHMIMKDEFRESPKQPVSLLYPDSVAEIKGLKPKEELRGIRGGDRVAKELSRIPGIVVAPALRGQIFLRYGSRDISANLIGIDPVLEAKASNIQKDMTAGSLNSLLTNSNGIILGAGLAEKLGARLGSKVTVVSPQGVIMIMKVVGLTRTGITSIDYTEAYALLKKSQILQKRDNRINLIKMRMKDVNKAEEMAAKIEAKYGYRTEGWQETNENVFSLFKVQNIIMYSVVTAIMVVAGFGIFNIISTVVNEKTRDIAILKSMGFGVVDIEYIFLMQGIIVGLVGTFSGWLLGYLLTEALASIPFEMGDKGVIAAKTLVVYRSFTHYVLSGTLAIISASISALLPARKAARLKPVDIIRSAA